jgi:hypothetical protein
LVAGRNDWSRTIRAQVVALLAAAGGFLLSYLLWTSFGATASGSRSARFVRTSGYFVWVLVAGAQFAYWAVISGPVWQWYRRLTRDFPLGRMDTVTLAAFALAPSAVILVPGLLYLERADLSIPLRYFTARLMVTYPLLLVVAIPATMGLGLLRRAAEGGGPLETYLRLEADLRRFLTVLGGVLTMAMLGIGALAKAYNAFYDGASGVEQVPPELLLVFGGIWAGVLAVVYLPTHNAIERMGERILDELSPLPAMTDSGFVSAVERREKVGTVLHLGGTARSKLEDSVIILSPLLGAIVSSFLGG